MEMKKKLQRRLVYFAKKHLGKPYKYSAMPWEAPRVFDCASFTQYLYKRIGINIPLITIRQAHLGKQVDHKKEKLQPGDLIFTRSKWGYYNPEFPKGIGHVAIYIGDGKIIHAKYKENKDGSRGGAVREDSVEVVLNQKDSLVIKRIL